MRRRLPAAALIALLLSVTALVTAGGSSFARAGSSARYRNPSDFRAFYCAGKVLLHGADPYRVEPLRSCEETASRAVRTVQYDGLVIAAPLPPYALAAFGLLSEVPYPNAVALWYWLLVLAAAVTAHLLRRLTTVPAVVVSLGWVALTLPALLLGQVLPVCALFLVAGAWALRRQRFELCAVLTTCTMLEPHLGLPSCLALFAYKREARKTLLLCAAVLAAATLLVAGPRLTLEYVLAVLPDHARSEVLAIGSQYSLTTALAALGGLSSGAAVAWGTVDYVLMCAVAILTIPPLVRLQRDEALVVLLPAAFAVFGGPFVHIYGLALAAPALLCLSVERRAGRLATTVFTVCLLGILASSVLETIFAGDLTRHGNSPVVAALAHRHGGDLASQNSLLWHLYERPADRVRIVLTWLVKIPALAGLGTFVVTATALGYGVRSADRELTRTKLPA